MTPVTLPQQLEPEFSALRLTSHITRIQDRLGVLMYLVEGDDRAVLIDTGWGVGDLAGYVHTVTRRPVTVLLTHGHLDHAFGAAWFDDVRMNPLDAPTVEAHQRLSASVIAEAMAQGRITAAPPNPAKFGSLTAGDVFDLGGLNVRPIAAAGHTPGSHAFLIAEERVLVTGDSANQRTFLFHDEATTVAQYQQSLSQLRRDSAGLYDRIYISHGAGDAPITLFEDLEILCNKIRARTDDAVPFEFMGAKGLIARNAPGPDHADENANIVYNPDRIE